MLDADFIRKNLDAVKANCANRNVKADVDAVVRLDDDRKKLEFQRGEAAAKQNQISKGFATAKTPEEKAALKAESGALKEQIVGFDAELKKVEAELVGVLLTIPNMTHPDAPVGTDDKANKVVAVVGEPTKFDFKPKDHVAI